MDDKKGYFAHQCDRLGYLKQIDDNMVWDKYKDALPNCTDVDDLDEGSYKTYITMKFRYYDNNLSPTDPQTMALAPKPSGNNGQLEKELK